MSETIHCVDPWGLGYTCRGGQLYVHRPTHDDTGATTFGPGVPFDHRPEMQHDPESRRSRLWRALLALDADDASSRRELPLAACGVSGATHSDGQSSGEQLAASLPTPSSGATRP